MKNDAGINDQHYWDQRFSEDWEAHAGPAQSRFFAALAVEHLPQWILDLARRKDLSIADWGCAQGDGTELLASCLESRHVTGIDFSATAVEQARGRYPGLRFAAVDWLAGEAPAAPDYGIVFSSNTLEHFHDPVKVLNRIAAHAKHAVLLALPFREMDRHEEHFFSFLPQNIPATLANGFQLVWSRVLDCRIIEDTSWPGEQIFLAYVDPQWLRQQPGLALQDCRMEVHSEAAEHRERMARHELALAKADIAAMRTSLEARALEIARGRADVEARDLAIARLEANLSTREQALEDWKRKAESNVAELAQRASEISSLKAEVGELGVRNARLEVDGNARIQELARVSAWASDIASNPAMYAIKRNSYLLVRGVYRSLPLSGSSKQKLVGLARRVMHPGAARQLAAPVAAVAVALPAGRKIVPKDGERDVFVFAVIDWHFRIQRPQHLAKGLAQAGRRVFFISNVFVDADDAGYQLERLDPALDLFQVKLHVKGAPQIYFAPASATTVQMLQASLARVLADFGALSSISIVQHAFWFPLVTTVPNSLWLYDCMDHHEGFGNVPSELVKAEQEMLRRSDLVVVTSSWLENFASAYNRSVAVVRNAVEYEFFASAPATTYRDPKGRRIIGYFGAIADWFDVALVRRIALAHTDCLVLLVGNDTVNAGKQLADLNNVRFTGEVPYRELPYYLYAFDVCLLPFQVTALTLATNPVKVYEYLAAGRPVVCVDLPEIAQFGSFVYRAADTKEFVAKVGEALAEEQSEVRVAERRAFAAAQTWHHRSVQLQQAIQALRLPKVSVVVLTYNNLQLTQDCLDSLVRETDYPNLEIVIVDNASTDGSREYLQAFAEQHPGTRLILNDDNLGFAAGNNVGLAAATGDCLVILNNDTVVTRGWVLTLMRHLQQDLSIGLAGPITNNIGNAARVATSYADASDMPSEAFSITLGQMGKNFPLRTAAFFCVMFHRAVYEACGPMCEDYGRGFFEDDDYCRRVEEQGLKVVCAEDVFVHHHLSASFKKLPSAERQVLFDQNRVRYEAKWGAWEPHTYSRTHAPAEIDAVRRLAAVPEHAEGRRFFVGRCAICGHGSRFFYSERSLWRESLTCEHCLATSRYRSVARGILRAIREIADIEADSLATLPKAGVERRLAVYDTQPPFYYIPCAYPLPDLLKRTGWIDVALSQYKPDMAPGAEISPGVTNQNLERLTFADESLDILVTSDVMEHVRLDEHAHREIHRVLRLGGAYVFTVPHDMDRPETLVRVRVDPQDPAGDEMLMEPEYHGDTNGDGSGVLSYRMYGRALCTFLEQLGFEVHYAKTDLPDEGVLTTELFYCRKVRA